MKGQWEYQIFAKGAKEAGDQIWVARYILEKNWRKIWRSNQPASKTSER